MHCKVVCQQGAFTPIGNPEVKEHAVPLQSQPVLKSVYTNWENGVCIYTSQNAKTPQISSNKKMKSRSFSMPYSWYNLGNSYVTHRRGDAVFRTPTRVLAKANCDTISTYHVLIILAAQPLYDILGMEPQKHTKGLII